MFQKIPGRGSAGRFSKTPRPKRRTQKEARYFVVAGLAVFERETFFLTQSLDQLQARYFPDADEPITFHATVLRAPEGMVAPPFDTLNFGVDSRQPFFRVPQAVKYGLGAISPSGLPIRWTGVRGYFNETALILRARYGEIFNIEVGKVLRSR